MWSIASIGFGLTYMVVSSSTRLLDSLSQRSVPAWLTAHQSHMSPIVTQGVLTWQATAEELLASVRCCSRRSAVTATTAVKLWMGYSTDSLCSSSWYGVGLVKIVARSRGGAARINPHNAPPGTVLDIKPSGLTVAVADGAVRLSNFLTSLGRPLLPTQLPLAIGQRLPRLTPYQQRSVAQFEQGIAEHERTWHQRLTQLQPLELPHSDAEPGLGSIFARLPLELEPALLQGKAEFQDCLAQFGGVVLLTALTGYLMGLCQRSDLRQRSMPLTGDEPAGCKSTCRGDIGLRSTRLQQMLCTEELMALFASHVPARFALDLNKALTHNLSVVLEELGFLEEAVTHRQDLALGVNTAKLPSLYPVLMEMVTEISEVPHRLGQALTIQVTESGGACAWFYNPAVLREEEVAQMQREFMGGLRAIAQAPDVPFSHHW